MPPGKALGESVWGYSRTLLRSGRGTANRQLANDLRTQAAHIHGSAPAQAANAAASSRRNASGKLINLIVEVLSPLIHAPGVPPSHASKIRNPAYNKARNSTLNIKAGLHTASRARPAGFGSVRPNTLPRHPAHQGLQSARNFSSSRPVFQNVVNNAPLGLRVLGDKDKLDMRIFKQEMRAALVKKRKAEAKGKSRAALPPDFEQTKPVPRAMKEYFTEECKTGDDISVQLIVPLNPVDELTPFLSLEEGNQSKFFSAMLMSDLRLLSELHGRHHARMRNLIHRLESAGCFEENSQTGQVSVKAELDEMQGRIIISFSKQCWSIADVKQVLGLWEDKQPSWYRLIDLDSISLSPSNDSLASTFFPSDVEVSLASVSDVSEALSKGLPASPTGSSQLGDVEEHALISQTLILPRLETSGSSTRLSPEPFDSYTWGVEEFIRGLNSERRPSFVSSDHSPRLGI